MQYACARGLLHACSGCSVLADIVAKMIDIATWRARIGLHRVRVGPSGRRAKVLRPDETSWSLLLALTTITIEVVVTVIILLVLSSGGQYHYIPPPAASLVNPGLLEKSKLLHSILLYILHMYM